MSTSHVAPRLVRSGRPVRDFGRILLGLVVVTVGVLFLLDAAGVLDAGQVIGDYWPAVIIATALVQFAERSHGLFEPSVLLVAGAVLLLVTADVVSGNVWDFVWPIAIIAAGLLVIGHWRGTALRAASTSDDVVVASGIFGGPTIVTESQVFRGGSLTAIFGGVTLDLRAGRPRPEGAAITATTAFGGIRILVPRGWRLVITATPIFGGVDDKTDHSVELAPDAPLLRIDGLCVFGGIEVKHQK